MRATLLCAALAGAAHAGSSPSAPPLVDVTGRAARAILRPGRSAQTTYAEPATPRRNTAALRGLTDSALWPAPVSEAHAAASDWKLVGKDVAAVSPDCPYLTHGDASSLAACQAGCANDGACNEINWNPTIPDCVYRACDNPLAPALTPTPGYDVYGILKAALALDPNDFAFLPVGAVGDVLVSAMRRYTAMAFVYSNTSATDAGAPAPVYRVGDRLGGGQAVTGTVRGLVINVTSPDADLHECVDESYNLTVTADPAPGGGGLPYGSVLTATTVFGALRGLETFVQLVQWNASSGAYSIQHTDVVDYPRFPFRGVLVDTARHFIPLSNLMAIVDAMAAVKLNAMHIHLSDDQSWPLEIFSYPRLTATGVFSNVSHVYRQADMRAFVAYAYERGVRVIPEFDTPSHFGTLQLAYSEYSALAYDSNNNSFWCLVDPSKEATFQFLDTVWGEIGTIFPDNTFMIGGDEFWDCWDDSPTVKKWMKANNFSSVYDAYHWYERRMIGIARNHSRSSMAWLDIAGFPAANETYADYPDVTINVWSGCYSGSWQADVSSLTTAGANVVVSGPYYITQRNDNAAAPHFTWRDMYGVDLFNFTGNTSDATARVKGGLLCAWDDAAESDAGDLVIELTPYLLGVSEAWWSPQAATSGVTPDDSRAHVHRCRMIARGLPSHPIFGSPYEPSFCAREAEAVLAPWEAA